MKYPLIKGGQGRSAQSVEDSAMFFTVPLLGCLYVLAAALVSAIVLCVIYPLIMGWSM